MKAYTEDSTESFIQCDSCEIWIHARCDGIDTEKLAKLEENDEKYVCPICRKKKAGVVQNLTKKK